MRVSYRCGRGKVCVRQGSTVLEEAQRTLVTELVSRTSSPLGHVLNIPNDHE
jgi:hypothetical protein